MVPPDPNNPNDPNVINNVNNNINATEFARYAFIVGYTQTTDPSGGIVPGSQKEFFFKPCTEVEKNFALENITSTSEKTKKYILRNGVCIDLPEAELKELFVDKNVVENPNSVIVIRILTCGPPINCVSPEHIKNRDLKIILPRWNFDPLNATDPLSLSANIDIKETFDDRSIRFIELVMKEVTIVDEKSDFFGGSLKKKYFEVDTIYKSAFQRNNPSDDIVTVVLRSGG